MTVWKKKETKGNIIEGNPWLLPFAAVVLLLALAIFLKPLAPQDSLLVSLYGDEGGETQLSDESLFFSCLLSKNSRLFGADWSEQTKRQFEILGTGKELVPFVNCSESLQGETNAYCLEKGISEYPTWEIAGKQFAGKKTLDELGKISGCER